MWWRGAGNLGSRHVTQTLSETGLRPSSRAHDTIMLTTSRMGSNTARACALSLHALTMSGHASASKTAIHSVIQFAIPPVSISYIYHMLTDLSVVE